MQNRKYKLLLIQLKGTGIYYSVSFNLKNSTKAVRKKLISKTVYNLIK